MKGARIRSDTGAACIPAALYNPAHCVVARKHTAIRLGGDVGCVSERVGANRIFYPAERIRRTSCGKPPHATTMIPTVSEILHRLQPLEVAAKCCAVAGAYLSGYAITSHFHEASSLTGAMLACTFFLPRYLAGGALLVGMACDTLITALLSLLLLRKKTGGLHIGTHLAKLFAALAPVTAAAYFIHRLLMVYLSYFPALAITMLLLAAGEAAMLSLLRLIDLKSLFARFFGKKRKKITSRS